MLQAADITFKTLIAASGDDSDESDDDFESVGDHHRFAAEHFAAAARHHLAAAAAEDEGDFSAADRHTFQAYRQRLHGVHYAEIAVLDSERAQDLIESDL